MASWRIALLFLCLLTLSGCVERISIEKKLQPSLTCKGFALYFPEGNSWLPYQKKVPIDPDEWEEATALLTYDQTIEHQIYVYRLTYVGQKILNDFDLDQEKAEATDPAVSMCNDKDDTDTNDNDNNNNDDDSQNDDTESDTQPLVRTVQITHFLKTGIRFPRFQHIRLRYYRYAPLLFEWVAPIRVCPYL